MTDAQDRSRVEHVQENFVRHMFVLRGFVLGLVPHKHLADDIVQETFLTACQKADTYEPGTNFRAWIFAIARFKALAMLNRDATRLGLVDPKIAALLADDFVEERGQPERIAALDGCVAKLTDRAREAVLLRYGQDLGPTEIAGQMGWSVNALNVTLSRARAFLRRCVDEVVRADAQVRP